jgi:N-acyl-L-homoserine lactone synthetase
MTAGGAEHATLRYARLLAAYDAAARGDLVESDRQLALAGVEASKMTRAEFAAFVNDTTEAVKAKVAMKHGDHPQVDETNARMEELCRRCADATWSQLGNPETAETLKIVALWSSIFSAALDARKAPRQ